ncbi:hypothetical protein FQA39_LY10727 [Lamprigera yunnana]|nr:hypothetical protein FQA39_LY10727 [Lamprigera yunnana]
MGVTLFRFQLAFFVLTVAFAEEIVNVSDEEYNAMPTLFYMDDYDVCMSLKEKALYCSVTVQLSPSSSTNVTIWNIIHKVSSNPRNYRHDRLRHKICVATTCPTILKNYSSLRTNYDLLRDEISECYNSKYNHLHLTGVVTQMYCETDKTGRPIDNWDIAVAAFLVGSVAFLIFATFYEGLARYKSVEEYNAITSTTFGSIVSCFSIVKNWKRLGGKITNLEVKPLKCMNTIKFYNIIAVVLSHSIILTFTIPLVNPRFLETASEKPFFMFVMNGTVIIQTYFLIAGWLLSYNFLLLMERQQKVKLLYVVFAFINRYIRLTPCLALVIAFNTTWMHHLGNGPLWHDVVESEYQNCRKNWWVNLLYINNYYDFEHICMLQTWYLGADTQLFILSLLIMTLIWKFKQFCKPILGISLVIGFVVPGLINYIYDYDIIVRYYPEPLTRLMWPSDEFRFMYVPGHTNIGGCIIGMIFGYIYYKHKNHFFFNKKSTIVLWWIVILGIPLTVIFIAYPFYQSDEYSRTGAAIYNSLSRNMFAFAFALAIFGATQKIGWFLRSCVVWPPLQILGRLSYCIYLIHFPLVRIRIGLGRTPAYITVYYLILTTIVDFTIACIFGLLLCLFVEMPTSALQKMMMPQMKNKRNQLEERKITNISVISNNHQMSKV